jgi:hypothetical protein
MRGIRTTNRGLSFRARWTLGGRETQAIVSLGFFLFVRFVVSATTAIGESGRKVSAKKSGSRWPPVACFISHGLSYFPSGGFPGAPAGGMAGCGEGWPAGAAGSPS